MTTFYGYKRLRTADDWRGLAGEDKWVPSRSAYELAHCWSRHGGLPRAVVDALDASGHELLRGLIVDLCLVEKPVYLESRIGPSMTDLMAYGYNSGGDGVVVAVEGKADESFGSRVSTWIRGDPKNPAGTEPRPSRVRRLDFLCKHLAASISSEGVDRFARTLMSLNQPR